MQAGKTLETYLLKPISTYSSAGTLILTGTGGLCTIEYGMTMGGHKCCEIQQTLELITLSFCPDATLSWSKWKS